MFFIKVVLKAKRQLALEISASDGRQCTVSVGTHISEDTFKVYQEVFGLPNEGKKRLTPRWWSVLLLLVLARLALDEVEKLGYRSASDGRLRLAAVSQLQDFAGYTSAREGLLKGNLRTFFPARSAVRIGPGRDREIWLDEERIEVDADPAAQAAILAYLTAARRPSDAPQRIVIEISGLTGEEVERASRRFSALVNQALAIRRGEAGREPAEAFTRIATKTVELFDLLIAFLDTPAGKEALRSAVAFHESSSSGKRWRGADKG